MKNNKWLSVVFGACGMMGAGAGCLRHPNLPVNNAAVMAVSPPPLVPSEKPAGTAVCLYDVAEISFEKQGYNMVRVDGEGIDKDNMAYVDYLLYKGGNYHEVRIACDPKKGEFIKGMTDYPIVHL